MENTELRRSEEDWFNPCGQPTKPLPSTLYYYCSVDSFIKIISNKSLWMTNLFFLNDSAEHFWLRNKVRGLIERKLEKNPEHGGYGYLQTILRQEWRRDIYCSCFSEHADVLSQWRAYGDDGKGFAIGFSTDHLLWLQTNLRGQLANVIYDENEQDTLIEWAFDLPPSYDGDEQTIEDGTTTILGNISEAACRCKNKAFSEEAEWRLVCEPIDVYDPEEETCWSKAGVPRYIERHGLITPYIEVPVVAGMDYSKRGVEPLKEVVFGPKNTMPEQRFAVEQLLRHNGFKRVDLKTSSASYR
jgi:hypothetical protein